jgi:hypothetical protein
MYFLGFRRYSKRVSSFQVMPYQVRLQHRIIFTLLLVGISVGEAGSLASPTAEEAVKVGASLVGLTLND